MMTTNERAQNPTMLMKLFAARAASGDPAGLLDLYELDAVFEPAPRVLLRGHDEIAPALVELTATRPAIEYAGEPEVVIVDDIALVSNTWTLTATLPDGTVVRQGGLSADVVRRQPDGSWLVLIDQPRGATLPA
ncbi:MAG: hypothetical protein RL238_3081 [Actinomycetota bacterium]|jgi:uncharacterized protein (TIGR02246 family)